MSVVSPSTKVKSFSGTKVALTGNPRNLRDPDANSSTGESMQERVARLEREKIEKHLEFAKRAQAVRKQDNACVRPCTLLLASGEVLH